jgi:hypothetical protein
MKGSALDQEHFQKRDYNPPPGLPDGGIGLVGGVGLLGEGVTGLLGVTGAFGLTTGAVGLAAGTTVGLPFCGAGLASGAFILDFAFSGISLALSAFSAPSVARSFPFSEFSAPTVFLSLTIEFLLAALLMDKPFSFPPSVVVAILLISAPFSAFSGNSLSMAVTFTSFFSSV